MQSPRSSIYTQCFSIYHSLVIIVNLWSCIIQVVKIWGPQKLEALGGRFLRPPSKTAYESEYGVVRHLTLHAKSPKTKIPRIKSLSPFLFHTFSLRDHLLPPYSLCLLWSPLNSSRNLVHGINQNLDLFKSTVESMWW